MAALIPPLLALLVTAPPIQTGDAFAGWRVTRVERHPEYRRYTLVRGGERTVVEVTYRRQKGSPWESRHYRVQPAPGHRAVLPLVRAMLARMKRYESRRDHQPLVRRYGGPGRLADLWEYRWTLLLGLVLAFALGGLVHLLRRPLQRALTWMLHLGEGLLARPPPAQDGLPAGPWTNALLAGGLGLIAAGLLLWLCAPPPLHSDTCLDLALARDCLDGAGCHRMGQGSSFQGFRQGGGWPLLLTGFLRLGAGARGMHVATTLLHGLALGLCLFVLLPGLPRHLAFLATMLVGAGMVSMTEYPTLWNPTLIPVALALHLLGTVGVLRTGRSGFGALALVAVTLAVEAHVVNGLLVLPTLFVVALADRRPWLTLVVGGGAALGLSWVVSSGAIQWNLVLLARHGGLLLGLALLGVPVGFGLALRPALRHGEGAALAVTAVLLLVLLLPLLPLGIERAAGNRPFYLRYLLPHLFLAAFVGAHLFRSLRRGPWRWWVLTAMGAALAAGTSVAAVWTAATPRSYWTLRDAERLSAGPFSRQPFARLSWQIRGPQHRDLLKCHVSLATAPWRTGPSTRDNALFVVLGEPGWAPPTAHRVSLGRDRIATVWTLRPWVDTPPLRRSPWGGAARSFVGRARRLVHDRPLKTQALPIHTRGSDPTRLIRLVPRNTPWRIYRVEGVPHRVVQPGRAVELRGGPPRSGMLHLRLTGPDSWFDPPSLIEYPSRN